MPKTTARSAVRNPRRDRTSQEDWSPFIVSRRDESKTLVTGLNLGLCEIFLAKCGPIDVFCPATEVVIC
jgi:hypothetical protein